MEAWGRSAHAGVEPEKGRNATNGLASLLVELDRLNGLRPGVTVNAGTVTGGTVANVVPGSRYGAPGPACVDRHRHGRVVGRLSLHGGRPIPAADIRFRFTDDEYSVMPAPGAYTCRPSWKPRPRPSPRRSASTSTVRLIGGAPDASWVAAAARRSSTARPIGGPDHSPDEYIELDSIVPHGVAGGAAVGGVELSNICLRMNMHVTYVDQTRPDPSIYGTLRCMSGTLIREHEDADNKHHRCKAFSLSKLIERYRVRKSPLAAPGNRWLGLSL
ncbi:MAG: peptidase dimerization domain-containing protein [Caldilineaceae bacterium]